MMIDDILGAAGAARSLAPPPGDPAYLDYCAELANQLEKRWDDVCEANRADVAAARERDLPDSLLDRLSLDERHLATLTRLTSEVADAVPDAVRPRDERRLGSGARIRRVPKPVGVIFMIYEARPTVTIEGALLPVAVGNTVILRGGSEVSATNTVLGAVAAAAATAVGLPTGMIQVLGTSDRAVLRELLRRHDDIDLLIPRGSPSLIDYCRSASHIPVLASGGGVNHLYVHASADPEHAAVIALDSKVAEPTACNTLEMVLVEKPVAQALVRALLSHAAAGTNPVRLRLDDELRAACVDLEPNLAAMVEPLTEHDDGREFLDRTIGVRQVLDRAAAAAHIRRHGSGHTEGVVTCDDEVAEWFIRTIDAAALVVNGSLRLHDGPTMGLGPELSISTGRLHVRGPAGLPALLSYSWVVDGDGTLRESDREGTR